MKNATLTTIVTVISYKLDGQRIVLECPLMDAQVVHNTNCIKEIDATLHFNSSLMTQNHRDELARRRQELVNTNIALYRSAGW